MSAEARLEELGIELPPAPAALGVYRPVVVVGQTAYTSGHLPLNPDGSLITGRVGADLDREAGYQAARKTCLAILVSLKAELGTLDRVRRVIKVVGLVNATADFTEHPAVINGCSELLAEVFGPEAGIGARSALGVASLPKNVPVEIEAVFEVEQH
jgi:enamine deaminase RidA (YjgF/YER057c/UK114 family)